MRLGDLRHLLRLERPATGAPDAYGQPPTGWEPVGSVYAEVIPLAGRELEFARQLEARTTHQVTVRHREGLNTTMRLVFGTRVLNIVAVRNENERNDAMIVLAQEVAA